MSLLRVQTFRRIFLKWSVKNNVGLGKELERQKKQKKFRDRELKSHASVFTHCTTLKRFKLFRSLLFDLSIYLTALYTDSSPMCPLTVWLYNKPAKDSCIQPMHVGVKHVKVCESVCAACAHDDGKHTDG